VCSHFGALESRNWLATHTNGHGVFIILWRDREQQRAAAIFFDWSIATCFWATGSFCGFWFGASADKDKSCKYLAAWLGGSQLRLFGWLFWGGLGGLWQRAFQLLFSSQALVTAASWVAR
jgi:hypothetical protein